MVRLLQLIALFLLLGMAGFAVFYLVGDHASLTSWYLGLNSCFYNAENWQQNFFTPQVKHAGNIWCTVALGSCLFLPALIIRDWKRQTVPETSYKIDARGAVWSALIILIGVLLWCYANMLLKPAYDEVFSAVNISSLPLFQAWSYYMLPNNHILFNLVNNHSLTFGLDRVMIGRVLSLAAYIGTLLLVFNWLSTFLKNRALALFMVVIIAIQLPTMGFAAQARGYELELFAGWLAFVSVYKYYILDQKNCLRWHAVAIWMGYAALPSFMYFHLTLLLFVLVWQMLKGFSLTFWKYTLVAGLCVFLFYLPALCFSGLSSFAENKYVTPAFSSFAQFWDDFPSRFTHYICWGLTFIFAEENPLNYVLFLLPCALLAAKERKDKMLGVFYIIQWIVFIAMVIIMQRFPFKRNLIIHYSISLCLLLYTTYLFCRFLAARSRLQLLHSIIFAVLVLPVAIHLATAFTKNAPVMLYGPDNNELYAGNKKSVASLNVQGDIAFSEESFYWLYLYRQRFPQAKRCTSGNERYFVKRGFESLPTRYSQYKLQQKYFEDYELYIKP